MQVPPFSAVNIRPGVSVLSVLKHLNYKPWYALAEFVDNAVQSALENAEALSAAASGNYQLRVDIEFDADGQIIIRDNAAGIPIADYERAFKTAEVPPNRTGLSEFGMGMKSAGFWFSPRWTVRTKALGENEEGFLTFDLAEILGEARETIPVQFSPAPREAHYTELVLLTPHKAPAGRTLGKIKDHLSSMYREFLRDGKLRLRFRDEPLQFEEPKILVAPFYKTPTAPPVEWKKDIHVDLGDGRTVSGFAAIRERASTADAGFALLRRNRLILGSADEGYRPEQIFGRSNSYRYQRLFGEFHVTGFKVSHTKDGFQWDEQEDVFLESLRAQLQSAPLPLLEQAEQHRVRVRIDELRGGAERAVASTASVIECKVAPVIEAQRDEPATPVPVPDQLAQPHAMAARREITLNFRSEQWIIAVELVDDAAVGDWLCIAQHDPATAPRRLAIRVSLNHPFMQRFSGANAEQIEPLLRIASALALAETVARDAGVRQAGVIRRNVNDLLRSALSDP